jgi:cytochrome c peroxidase
MPKGRIAPGKSAIDAALASRGAALFQERCARCHSPQGDRTGRVEPIADLGTDPHRIREFIVPLQDALNRLGTDQWRLRRFRVQDGYVNTLLDGVWLRAPYLHNGSVPTLRDLLNPPEQRPTKFCRGGDDYDWSNLGFVSATSARGDGCPTSYLYDTRIDGNGNQGHLYGTGLPDADKEALVEFMKTL